MPSSADAFDAAIRRAAETVQDAVVAAGLARAVILIDGRSGAGKTTLAALLRERWSGDVQIVALDDVYPGWDGLAAGAEIVREQILEPLANGTSAHWRRWDWARAEPGETMVTDATTPVIIEGSGVLTPASAVLAPIRVWLESPTASRRERALARDGDTYRPHWDRWAAQEDVHLTADAPRDLATIIIDVP
ncbi:MAG: hypothetical protein ABS62_06210 [Microbacterium sp. SCN 70-200]|uniref:hypothetical protein n=1 Tax=unclassified Microbacterium TaxID=2609290 RepID=UPI00086B7AB7|nr:MULTISPECIES: hypothetical protein [unclassified Microbacterium]MBN9214543.1 hypothetical protein [Microbacterium sp.]ODT41437.1 MAG: hypothetical protein ABS62_06210 [Microbacterium sp. SCN 70-200]OJV84083.1 MAG: hypothetical protein BGO46_14145 [Microbacterium sp. 70-16]